MGISVTKLLIVLAIAIVIFGSRRLLNVGSDLGAAIKNFRAAIKEGESEEKPAEKEDKPAHGEVKSEETEKD
jgi:sec-independent protein translocase protein TatA